MFFLKLQIHVDIQCVISTWFIVKVNQETSKLLQLLDRTLSVQCASTANLWSIRLLQFCATLICGRLEL